ncbi:molecular chaperone [Klebsiella michiganensis]
MNRMKILLGAVLFFNTFVAQAGVVLGGTRIVYPADRSEVQITLKNIDSDQRYLVQSWVSHVDDSKAPFIITPPIYKLAEKSQTLLHIVFTGNKNTLPQDRESLYLMNVKSVSAVPAELREKNMLQFAVKTRIKLFYRPTSLDDRQAKIAGEKLEFRIKNNLLVVKNPTPFYITLGKLTIGGKSVESANKKETPSALSMMIAPLSEQSFTIPGGARGQITWSTINDYGTETAVQKKTP